MPKPIDTSKFPVMKARCSTCPFEIEARDGYDSTGLATMVRDRSLLVSQICHHPRLHGKPETHLCRGGRDHQLILMHRMGIISEPTDEAWDAKRKQLGIAT